MVTVHKAIGVLFGVILWVIFMPAPSVYAQFHIYDLNAVVKEKKFISKIDNFILILDRSDSMSEPYTGISRPVSYKLNAFGFKTQRPDPFTGKSKLRFSRELALRIIKTLPDLTFDAMVLFGGSGDVIYGPTEFVKPECIDRLKKASDTGVQLPSYNIFDALRDETQDLYGQIGVVVITDGKIEDDVFHLAYQLKNISNHHICMYGISVGKQPDEADRIQALCRVFDCGSMAFASDLASGELLAEFVAQIFFGDDNDADGVADAYDKCPGTPAGVAVDADGCVVDTDGDGIADLRDNCPGTPQHAIVDLFGCPFDGDRDGVIDDHDQCPETPAGIAVDKNGCSLDSDMDGVKDALDRCPHTPFGVLADENGCPYDNETFGKSETLPIIPNHDADIGAADPGALFGKFKENRRTRKGGTVNQRIRLESMD